MINDWIFIIFKWYQILTRYRSIARTSGMLLIISLRLLSLVSLRIVVVSSLRHFVCVHLISELVLVTHRQIVSVVRHLSLLSDLILLLSHFLIILDTTFVLDLFLIYIFRTSDTSLQYCVLRWSFTPIWAPLGGVIEHWPIFSLFN